MSSVNIGKKAAALVGGSKDHLSAQGVCELMLALREDFDWVSTVCGHVLLKGEPNRPEETLALLSNTFMLMTVLDTPVLQQLYRRTLERAAQDLVQYVLNDSNYLETEVGKRFWQDFSFRVIGAHGAGYFSGSGLKSYLINITEAIARAANILRDEDILQVAATLRCLDDLQLASSFVLERKQWQSETVPE